MRLFLAMSFSMGIVFCDWLLAACFVVIES
jgi:hypothetical protein